MSLKHGLLGIISSEGSMTGYELDKFFKGSLNYFWQAKTSQIYRELNTMEDLGWLTSERVIQEEKPNKKVYSITSQGKEELLKWLLLPDTGLDGEIKSPLLMRIFFAGEAGEQGRVQAIKLLRELKQWCMSYRANIENVLKEIVEDEAGGAYSNHVKYWKIVALSGEMSLNYHIDWADKAIAILEEEEK